VTEPNLKGAPSLVVEVLSDPRTDRVGKRALYARAGVIEYWIVDPDADRVEVYRLHQESYGKPAVAEAGDVLRTDLLPGLEVDVADLVRSGR
jgi:Uma2 family endonuclease